MANFTRIKYKDLNPKQQENYNFQKISGVFAEYGFVTLRLSDDWKNADFIAQHIDGETHLKVQLKGRLTFSKKYIGKSLYIAFPEADEWYLYHHDETLDKISEISGLKDSNSWKNSGLRHYPKIPKKYKNILLEFRIYPFPIDKKKG